MVPTWISPDASLLPAGIQRLSVSNNTLADVASCMDTEGTSEVGAGVTAMQLALNNNTTDFANQACALCSDDEGHSVATLNISIDVAFDAQLAEVRSLLSVPPAVSTDEMMPCLASALTCARVVQVAGVDVMARAVLVVGTDAARFWTAASNDLNLMSFTAADNSSHPEMATLAGSDFWDESVNITVQAS
jgi:hypothetical protein